MSIVFVPFHTTPSPNQYCGLQATDDSISAVKAARLHKCGFIQQHLSPRCDYITSITMLIVRFICECIDLVVVDAMFNSFQTEAAIHSEMHESVSYNPFAGFHLCCSLWSMYANLSPCAGPLDIFNAPAVFIKIQQKYQQLINTRLKAIKWCIRTDTINDKKTILLFFTDNTNYYMVEWDLSADDLNYDNTLWYQTPWEDRWELMDEDRWE